MFKKIVIFFAIFNDPTKIFENKVYIYIYIYISRHMNIGFDANPH